MSQPQGEDSENVRRQIQLAASGDAQGWKELLDRHHGRLRRMVALRLDQRLTGRVDPSDVIQEAYLAATKSLPEFVQAPSVPFFVWLRSLCWQKLMECHRHHLGVRARNAGREVSLYRGALPEASSVALAARLLGRQSRPSEAACRAEMKLRIETALNAIDPIDREILVLRHFEQLTNGEAARVLGLQESATSKRYIRALQRIKSILTDSPGRREDWL